jgi:hypothetical protein
MPDILVDGQEYIELTRNARQQLAILDTAPTHLGNGSHHVA